MNKANYYEIIRSPIITEKATNLAEKGKYVFSVSIDATKLQIKKAVEHIFSVKATNVNVLVAKGKEKRFRGRLGRRNDCKKAIVTLEKGQEINFVGEA